MWIIVATLMCGYGHSLLFLPCMVLSRGGFLELLLMRRCMYVCIDCYGELLNITLSHTAGSHWCSD
jgi:hypothetical protein